MARKVESLVALIFRSSSFAAFIRCYLFLRKVAEYVGDSTDQVFKEQETEYGRSKFQERNRNARASRP